MGIMRWCLPAQKTRLTTYFECTIFHIGVWALSYALPLRCEIFLSGAREHSFPLYLKEINCFEKMLYRKIDFTFCGVTLFKRALKCISLNIMKKSLVHYGDNALVFASTKN